jgi:hypothetical protein
MIELLKVINKKINGSIWAMAINGLVLLLLAVLIIWTDFMLRLVCGLVALVMSYMFFYGAYKVWSIKKGIQKFLK